MEPDRVSVNTIDLYRHRLHENIIRGSFRRIILRLLNLRYSFIVMGDGFRWGNDWDVRRGVLSFGHFVYIGPRVQIIYPTVIGDLVMIAADVQFIGNDHIYSETGVPMRFASGSSESRSDVTTVLSEAWIGQRVIVMHGVTIGRGAVVAAGSLVTKNVPDYSVVAGVPARIIKMRFDEKQILQHQRRLYQTYE